MNDENKLSPLSWPDDHVVYPETEEEYKLLQIENVDRIRQQLLCNDPNLEKDEAKRLAAAIKKHKLDRLFVGCRQIVKRVQGFTEEKR